MRGLTTVGSTPYHATVSATNYTEGTMAQPETKEDNARRPERKRTETPQEAPETQVNVNVGTESQEPSKASDD